MKRSSVKFRAPHDAEIVQDVHILLPVAAVMAADRLALAVQLGTEGLYLVNTVVGREGNQSVLRDDFSIWTGKCLLFVKKRATWPITKLPSFTNTFLFKFQLTEL